MRLGLCALATVAALVAVPSVACADDELDRGIALEQANQCAPALDAFRKISKPSPIVKLHIARCEERLGHVLKAELALGDLTAATLDDDAPPEWVDAQEQARRELARVSKRVGRIRITAPEGLDSLYVTLDGTPLDVRDLDDVRRVDPGRHVIRGSATGYSAEETTVNVREGLVTEVALTFEAISGSPAKAAVVIGAVAFTIGYLGSVLLGPIELIPIVGPFIPVAYARPGSIESAIYSYGLFAAALRIGGSGLWTFGLSIRPKSRLTASFTPIVSPRSQGLGLVGQF